MKAEIVGYTFGVFIMTFAVAVLLQFGLNKIPGIKGRLILSYGLSGAIGLSFILLSLDFGTPHKIAAVFVAVAFYWRYKIATVAVGTERT